MAGPTRLNQEQIDVEKILIALAFCYVGACFAAMDTNTATDADLDSIKGIGPAMSSKILDERNKDLANQKTGRNGLLLAHR